MGKQRVAYTDFTLSSCRAFHGDAVSSTDLNGSKAGFFCNGPPQGGVYGAQLNT